MLLDICHRLRLRGRHRDGARAAAEARVLFTDAGHTQGVTAAMLHGGWLAAEDDRMMEAAGSFNAAGEAARRTGDQSAAVAAAWAGAWLECVSGQPEAAVLSCARLLEWGPAAQVAAVADANLLPSPRGDALATLVRNRVAWELGRPALATDGSAGWMPASVAGDPLTQAVRCEAEMLACAACGAWPLAIAAIERGASCARRARAPLVALGLHLTMVECAARTGERAVLDNYRRLLWRWDRATLPGWFRRRLNALLRPHGQANDGGRRPRGDEGPPGWSPGPEGIWDIMDAFNAASDERSGIEQACEVVRARLDAAAVTVFVRDGGGVGVIANAGGRRCGLPPSAHRLIASVAETVDDTLDGDDGALWPIRAAGEVAGVVTARWSGDRAPVSRVRTELLRALAMTIAPAVHGLAAGSSIASRSGEPPAAAAAGILGTSGPVAALRALVMRAAETTFPVLIQGESGTGKELAARAIHVASARRHRRFCAVNCAALSDDLLEAELFGHARGAFTGAVAERAGLFEEADGGTLFLDEVGELSARAQAKLLRALQEHEIRRVGENHSRRIDVRIVAATNRPLADECHRGRFREDLFYRLNVVRLDVPPLRDRPEDVRVLAERFWSEAAAQAGSRAVLTAEAIAVLSARPWPGNVRELQNTLAALAIRAPKRGRMGARDLAWLSDDGAAGGREPTTLDDARKRFEAQFVRDAMSRNGGRGAQAARELGVTRQGLAKLLVRLGLR